MSVGETTGERFIARVKLENMRDRWACPSLDATVRVQMVRTNKLGGDPAAAPRP